MAVEYRVIQLPKYSSPKETEKLLNTLGEDGWTIEETYSGDQGSRIFIFSKEDLVWEVHNLDDGTSLMTIVEPDIAAKRINE